MSHIVPEFRPVWISQPFEHFENHYLEAFRAANHDELPTSQPFVRYVEHKWEVDPERFDHYHPRLGQWIEESQSLGMPHEPSPPTCPVVVVPPASTEAHAVPEPTGLLLMMLGVSLFMSFVMWKRRTTR
jgi:PEP-CTERM motif